VIPAKNKIIFGGLRWPTKIAQIFGCNYFWRLLEINFSGYSDRCHRKFENCQKLFSPIFGGYAQAAENIIDPVSMTTRARQWQRRLGRAEASV
jgi:hypothetical protein